MSSYQPGTNNYYQQNSGQKTYYYQGGDNQSQYRQYSYQNSTRSTGDGQSSGTKYVYYNDSNRNEPTQYRYTYDSNRKATYDNNNQQNNYYNNQQYGGTTNYNNHSETNNNNNNNNFQYQQNQQIQAKKNYEQPEEFIEDVDPSELQEEVIDIDDLDNLMTENNPELKSFQKKTTSTPQKTNDEEEMNVAFMPPKSGKYPREQKRLPTKEERYNDVNTNFGYL